MQKSCIAKEQKFKSVPTISFLLQSNWKGDINTLEPFTISLQAEEKRHQGMKKIHKKNYSRA